MVIISPSSTSAIVPPSAASGETCPIAAPLGCAGKFVCYERHTVTETAPNDCSCGVEHFSHSGTALRPSRILLRLRHRDSAGAQVGMNSLTLAT